jgi:two-component system chemotaxis response regulator CheY
MAESAQYTILVVDDEELVRNLVVTLLSKSGHSSIAAVDGVDALNRMEGNKIDAVITDIKMPNMDGVALTVEILKRYPGLPILVMTAFDEEYSAGAAIAAGAREYIKKPFSPDEFFTQLQKMINDSEAIKRLKNEKVLDENVQDLMSELEESLKEN